MRAIKTWLYLLLLSASPAALALSGNTVATDNVKARLVSEVAGRIPMAGEVVLAGKTRLEVLASTDRRVERLRVSTAESPAA